MTRPRRRIGRRELLAFATVAAIGFVFSGCGSSGGGGGGQPAGNSPGGGGGGGVTISGLSPESGPTSGGTTVVISGTGFVSGTTVQLGHVTVTAANINANSLEVLTPAASAGKVDVIIRTPVGDEARMGAAFEYQAGSSPPTLTIQSVTPSGGPAGTLVTINGTGFTTASSVRIGSTAASSVTFVSPSVLEVVVGRSSDRGPTDVRVEDASSAALSGGFWRTATGLPGNDPRLPATIPSGVRNEKRSEPEVVSSVYGYQPWLAMIPANGSSGARAEVDWLELVVRDPGGIETVIDRDDFNGDVAWGELLWQLPWGVSSGYGQEYLSTSSTALIMDSANRPPNEPRAVYWHSWTRSWPRKTIAFSIATGSALVLRMRFRCENEALLQIGIDRYPSATALPPPTEVALRDYHDFANWTTIEVVIAVTN